MPSEGPGVRFDVLATKIVNHGDPCVEIAHPGIAAKSAQIAPGVPSVAGAAAAQAIAVGEDFVIMMTGVHEVATSKLPVGANAAGGLLYIRASDNALVAAATALTSGALNAGFFRFGVVDSVDASRGVAQVNLNLRGAF